MLLKDKSDTELLEVLTQALIDDDNVLLNRLSAERQQYGSNGNYSANVSVIETIIDLVRVRLEAKPDAPEATAK